MRHGRAGTMLAIGFGICGALTALAAPKAAYADPSSPYYSQRMLEQQIAKQVGPWGQSKVNVAGDVSSATSMGALGTPVLGLSGVAPGQGVAMEGVGAAIAATDTALSSSLGIVSGAANTGAGLTGTNVVSPGSSGSSAMGGLFGALGLGR